MTPPTSTVLYVQNDFQIVVVSFRGTENAQDFVTNLFTEPKQGPYPVSTTAKIHEVWYKTWDKDTVMKDAVLKAIKVKRSFDDLAHVHSGWMYRTLTMR